MKINKLFKPDVIPDISVKNSPDCIILGNWVFENFILADEPFAKASWIFETCLSVNNNVHCIVITNDGGMGKVGGGWFLSSCGLGHRGWLSSYNFCLFSCAFVFCFLMFSVPLFRCLEHDGCCVCFCIFSLFSLSLVPLTRSY